LLAFACVLGACSGGSGKQSASDVSGSDSTSATQNGTQTQAAEGTADAPATAGGGGGSASATTITSPSGVQVSVPRSGGPPVANLFTPAEDKIGIHNDKIVFCGHAATTFGPAFNTSEADLNVYWEEVGKIHGRTVELTFENDNYDPTTARQAAQACYDKKPFILFGGIGFDQIPAVRKFAEDKHILYYHHIAAADDTKKYSFNPLPSVEQVGTFGAEWIGTKYKTKKIGVIYRESENWDPGHKTFLSTVRSLGGKVVVDVGVTKNQGSYLTEINELRSKGAQVVFLWENALAATAILQEAKGQNYSPKFVVFPFNVSTDAWGNQALNPPVDGVALWPAYSPGDYSGPFASYAGEIKKMEQVYAERRPGIEVTDIHWQVWLFYRDLHRLLDQCGRDCTRNKILGLSLSKPIPFSQTTPSCPVDFTRNGHVGGFWASMFTAYRKPNGEAGWRHIPNYVCRDSFR
jgi:hypothetical protein